MFSIVLRCDLSFEDSKDDNDIYTTILKIPGTYVFDELRQKEGMGPDVSKKQTNSFKKTYFRPGVSTL